MDKTEKLSIQANFFEFAFSELVRNQRNSFQPLWTVDSWVKFLIWTALNSGFSGEKESIGLFIEGLGSRISIRMRKMFFERVLEHHGLHLMADPAEANILLLPLDSHQALTKPVADAALTEVGLIQRVVEDQQSWEFHNGIIAIPWKNTETCS